MLFVKLFFLPTPAFSQKAGVVEVTLQMVHKNAMDTSKTLKSEIGLIVEVTNHTTKNIALPVSGFFYQKELKFYRRNRAGVYELITQPYILQKEQQEKTQEYLMKNHRTIANFMGIDYNFEPSLGKDFYRYWDTFEQDTYSRKLNDGLTLQELKHFTKNVSRYDSTLAFYFLRSGDRQTVFWNLEFMLREKGDYKVTFNPFQFDILLSPLVLTNNFEIGNHLCFHSNEIYIKTY
ncbi:hypothetical protein DR864_18845 [Runella rosea]|uniref:Uncharacterized protein n=1 Tax=Runella rosea TaxID=2259595 RepID=A0A344TLX5_9BACT|nr:hypothetical protein DR864_18845 [Runella rosea]